jgi:hypothetical protein
MNMKLVKILSFLIVILVTNSVFSQTVKTEKAKILSDTVLFDKGNKQDDPNMHGLLEGTIITVSDRKKQAIEKIKPGQKILVWDPVKKKMDRQEVVKIYSIQHSASDMISIHYHLNNKQVLSMTADYPVYSLTGWLSANPEAMVNYKRYAGVNVGKLDSDAMLYRISDNGKRLMKKKTDSIKGFDDINGTTLNTYTLELDGNGIFFANGFAVGQK